MKKESEIKANMDFLLKELKKEWRKSEPVCHTVLISLKEAGRIHMKFQTSILKRQAVLEQEETTFEEAIKLTKENYILLRLLKKINKQETRAVKEESATAFQIFLDREEYKLYQEDCMKGE